MMANLVCAWHRMYFPNEPAPILGPAPGCKGDSHGMCSRCAEQYKREMTPALAFYERRKQKKDAVYGHHPY
jgi:hypothetical protein